MKRFFLQLFFVGIAVVAFVLFINNKVENNVTVEDDYHATMSGYYFDGYLDERAKENEAFEKEYFYYMDHYLHDYINNSITLQRAAEQADDEYATYFQSIGGLKLISLPEVGKHVQNGDYITFVAKAPIKESYPAMIDKISDVEVLYPRKVE